MLWRQILRVATQRHFLCKCAYNLKWNGQYICLSKLQNVNGGCLSTWNDGINKADPFQEGPHKRSSKKKLIEPKITLIGTDENISIISLEDGHKIAKRRNLRLVKLKDFDTKTQRPVYRLMSISEFSVEYKKEKASKGKSSKREKLLTFSSRISEHDIQSKVKMMYKWVSKEHEVRVIINGDPNDVSAAEEVYKKLESCLKETARFLQKRQVHADLRFTVQGLPGSKPSGVQGKKEPDPSSSDS